MTITFELRKKKDTELYFKHDVTTGEMQVINLTSKEFKASSKINKDHSIMLYPLPSNVTFEELRYFVGFMQDYVCITIYGKGNCINTLEELKENMDHYCESIRLSGRDPKARPWYDELHLVGKKLY